MSLTIQLQTMLAMVAMGSWLGVAIDTYSRLIRGRSWYAWVTIINDALFWIFQGLFVFFVLLQINEGEMRFYVLVALLCGFSAYQALFRNFYQKVLEAFIQFTIKAYRFIRSAIFILIINPTKELLKLLYTVCMMIISFVITVGMFVLKVVWTPFSWIGRGLWRLLPKEKLNKMKKKIGIIYKVKKLLNKWFSKKE